GSRAAAVRQLKADHVRVGVRPGDIALGRGEEPAGGDAILAEVRGGEPSEGMVVGSLRAGGVAVQVQRTAERTIQPGARLRVRFDTSTFYLFDPASGAALGGAAEQSVRMEERNGFKP